MVVTDKQAKAFYNSKAWKKLRAAVLKLDHYECQQCKARGIYTRAQTVHHVHHLKDRWDLRLSLHDENGDRQLVSLCNECHNAEHPEKAFKDKAKRKPLTPERW